MKIYTSINISASKEEIWKVITNIKDAEKHISAISNIEILQNSEYFIGFKWKETRSFLGKEATEVMWITEAVENEYYKTRAESHGTIYISTLRIIPQNNECILEMEFEGKPQTMMSKIMGFIFMPLFKKATIKAFLADLEDLKRTIEAY